jgi:hypothetical protein
MVLLKGANEGQERPRVSCTYCRTKIHQAKGGFSYTDELSFSSAGQGFRVLAALPNLSDRERLEVDGLYCPELRSFFPFTKAQCEFGSDC